MAGRDYATKRGEKARKTREGKSSILVPIVVALLPLLAAAGFGGGYWLGLQNGMHRGASPDRPDLTAVIDRQKQEIASLKAEKEELLASNDQMAKVGELNFYHDLPRQSVEPTPTPVPEKAEPAAMPDQAARAAGSLKFATPALPDSVEGYLLQVASFPNQDDAGKLQARLAAHGLKAYFKAVDLPQRGRWYRVYLGPYAERTQAEKAKAAVRQQFRLDALIVRASS